MLHWPLASGLSFLAAQRGAGAAALPGRVADDGRVSALQGARPTMDPGMPVRALLTCQFDWTYLHLQAILPV